MPFRGWLCNFHIACLFSAAATHTLSQLPFQICDYTKSYGLALFTSKVEQPIITNVTKESCMVFWEHRENAVGYFVEKRWEEDVGWLRCNNEPITTNMYHVTGLQAGRLYEFRIVSVDEEDVIDAIGRVTEIYAGEPPGPPSLPVIQDVSDTSCRISWLPPASDGGLPIREYAVYRRNRKEGAWTQAALLSGEDVSCRITGLQAGQQYEFSVEGRNDMGPGPHSPPTDPITMRGVDLLQRSGSLTFYDSDTNKQAALDSVTNSFKHGIDGVVGVIKTVAGMEEVVQWGKYAADVKKLQYHSHTAKVNLKESLNKIEVMNEGMARRLEQMATEQGQKERELMKSKSDLSGLQSQMQYMTQELSNKKYELNNANNNYYRAVDSVSQAERALNDEKRHQEVVKRTGAGLMAIPIVGWIAGGIMVTVSLTALEDRVNFARNNRNSAKYTRDQFQVEVSNIENSLRGMNDRMAQKEREITNQRHLLSELTSRLDDLRQMYNKRVKMSTQLRSYEEHIAGASDKAEVLDDQLKYFYNLELLLTPLHELAEHLSAPSSLQDHLLWSDPQGEIGSRLQIIAKSEQHFQRFSRLEDHIKGMKALATTSDGRKNQLRVTHANVVVSQLFPADTMSNDQALMMSSHLSWEQIVIPAPMTIAIFRQLLIISKKKDLPLTENRPAGGFKHLSNEDSLRASLLQVSREVRGAFLAAQRGMGKIRDFLQVAPKHIEHAINMLTRASIEDIEHTLHLPLRALAEIIENCLSNCEDIQQRFTAVVNTMQELQEVCFSYKGDYEWRKKENMILKASIEAQRKSEEEHKNNLNKQREMLTKSMDKAFHEYEKAVKDIPSTGSLIAMRIVSSIFGSRDKKIKKVFRPSSEVNTAEGSEETPHKVKEQCVQLRENAEQLTHIFLQADQLVMPDNSDAQNVIIILNERLKRMKKDIRYHDKEQRRMEDLAESGQKICEDIKDAQKSFSSKNSKKDELAVRIGKFRESVYDVCNNIDASVEEMRKPPSMSNWEPDEEIKGNLVDDALQKQEIKLRSYSMQLKQAQAQLEATSKKMETIYKQQQESLMQQTAYDDEVLNAEQIIDLLSKGLEALSDIRQQWWKMTDFFQKISVIVETSLSTSLQQFMKYAKAAQDQSLASYTPSHLARDLMYQQVAKTLDQVHHVQMIASTYAEISKKYLMANVDMLPEQLASGIEHRQQLQMIEKDRKQMTEDITKLLREKEDEWRTYVQRRVARI